MNDDTKKKWHAIDVIVKNKAAEAIEFAFNSLDARGTAINQLRKGNSETVTVTGYFDTSPDDKLLHDELLNALRVYEFDGASIRDIVHSEVEDADWLAEWKKHWRPTTIGRFVIAPPWSDVADTDKIIIRIEPNMAFGTGTHETTQLCLKAIGESYAADMSLLDVGTGTGILAIAAAKLARNGTQIAACDTDVDSVSIARQNAIENGVGEMIGFSIGSISEATPACDFVCANLTLDVIMPLLPMLLGKSRLLLLLSGILVEQEDTIKRELGRLQVTEFQVERAGEWISILINTIAARTE